MSHLKSEVDDVWRNADCIWDRQQVERAIDKVAQQITADVAATEPLVIVVMKGGMIFGSALATRLKFSLVLDYIHVTRYGAALQGSDLQWLREPGEPLVGRHVILVDDILDEGKTLQSLVQYCHQHQAADVKTAVLVNKAHERKAKPFFKADYCCLEVPDRYVFGYGMDYKGYLRNVDGIFAVKGA